MLPWELVDDVDGGSDQGTYLQGHVEILIIQMPVGIPLLRAQSMYTFNYINGRAIITIGPNCPTGRNIMGSTSRTSGHWTKLSGENQKMG